MSHLHKLYALLDRKTKVHLWWLMLFSIVLSVVEVVGISAVMPFIDIAINFNVIHSNQYYQWLYVFFNFEKDVDFAIIFGLVLFGFYLFRCAVNLLHVYAMSHFTENLYAQTTRRLFKVYLTIPYQVFTNKNSSYLTKTIVTEATLMSKVIRDVLVMFSEIFVALFLYALMLFASWQITFVFTAVLLVEILFLTKTVSKKIKKVGGIREESQAEYYEVVNRVLGNFEHIKLQDDNRLKDIGGDFSKKVAQYADASASYNFLYHVPRLFIETVGFSLVIFLLIYLLYSNQSDVSYILPVLSLFILALYRLMPSVNRIVGGYNALMYYHKSIDIIGDELKAPQENLASETVTFGESIKLTNVSFSYKKETILNNINLTIKKGDKTAFVGESGSGKSTLVDLIIGLHQSNEGEIKVDGVLINESNLQHWRSQVGYISQQVYLFDSTIEENVCFGRKIDQSLLEKVLKQANIFDFLQTKKGVKTLVGEGGVQLSGGQKQRIAIARALYGQPEILVLDEATSALDDETEKKIMDEIYQVSQDKTLIIVAHRLGTIQGCDKIYKVKNKVVERQ